jgi:hypothetical protein
MVGKGCDYFYCSDDYGKTENIKPLSNAFFATCWRSGTPVNQAPFLRQAMDQVIFVPVSRNAVWLSPDLGVSWANILSDSIVTSAEVKSADLYVLTSHGTLLKTNPATITAINEFHDGILTPKLIVHDNEIINNQSVPVVLSIFDLNGQKITSLSMQPLQTLPLSLSSGCYFVRGQDRDTAMKIQIR